MKKTRFVVALALISWLCFPLPAAEIAAVGEKASAPSGEEEAKKPDPLFKVVLKDTADIWTSPFHWRAKDWLWFGAVAATTGILIANDEGIYSAIKDFQAANPTFDDASPVFTKLCEAYSYGIAGLFLIHGLVFRDSKSRDTGIQALEAMLQSVLVVQLSKHLTGRQRPSVDGRDYWHGPSAFFWRYQDGFRHYDAFFSGHTVTIWSLATVLAGNYRGVVPWLAYGAATLAGLSTITEDMHWLSDVFLGAVVGYAIGRLVVRNHRRNWQLTPIVGQDRAGISLSILF